MLLELSQSTHIIDKPYKYNIMVLIYSNLIIINIRIRNIFKMADAKKDNDNILFQKLRKLINLIVMII